MLVYIQWARGTSQDWEQYVLTRDTDIRNLPRRPEPGPGVEGTIEADIPGFGIRSVLDVTSPTANDPGWVYALCIQGVTLGSPDWYHLTMDGSALVVTMVCDDVQDYPGTREARRYRFAIPTLDGTTGRFEQRITREEAWAEDAARRARYQAYWPIVNDWTAWSAPGPANKRLYCIWQTDDNVAAQEAARTTDPDTDPHGVRDHRRWLTDSGLPVTGYSVG